MANPKESHWATTKWIFKYIRGTIEYDLFHKKGKKMSLIAYSDNNYVGDLNDRKNTSSSIFMMGTAAISCTYKKQHVVSLSTTEDEYIATGFCDCQCIWLRRILENLELEEKEATNILCDNNSTIQLSKNLLFHGRSRHIELKISLPQRFGKLSSSSTEIL